MFIMLFVKRSNNEHVAPFFLEKFRIARKAIFAPDAKRIGNLFENSFRTSPVWSIGGQPLTDNTTKPETVIGGEFVNCGSRGNKK